MLEEHAEVLHKEKKKLVFCQTPYRLYSPGFVKTKAQGDFPSPGKPFGQCFQQIVCKPNPYLINDLGVFAPDFDFDLTENNHNSKVEINLQIDFKSNIMIR